MKPGICAILLVITLLMASGCASLHFMDSDKQMLDDGLAACARLQIAPTHYFLAVNISSQTVSLFESGVFVKKFSCSTSRFGIGQEVNSNRTPLGLHRIAEKIGDGEAPG